MSEKRVVLKSQSWFLSVRHQGAINDPDMDGYCDQKHRCQVEDQETTLHRANIFFSSLTSPSLADHGILTQCHVFANEEEAYHREHDQDCCKESRLRVEPGRCFTSKYLVIHFESDHFSCFLISRCREQHNGRPQVLHCQNKDKNAS